MKKNILVNALLNKSNASRSLFFSVFGVLLILAMIWIVGGCASKQLQVAQIPSSADPNVEIAQLDADIMAAESDQINVLAPYNFLRADQAFKEAQERRSSNKLNVEILEKIAEGRAYLKLAKEKGQISRVTLGDVMLARTEAITAGAFRYFQDDFAKAEDDLVSITQGIERGDTSKGERQRERLYNVYHSLEVRGVREAHLGETLKALQQAKEEGAQQWAPKTLSNVEKTIADVEGVIAKDPKNEQIKNLAENANRNTQYLLEVTRKSKLVKTRNPEETAIAMEKQKEQIAAAGREVETRQETIGEQQKRLTTLEEEKLINERFKRLSSRFSSNEADVFRTDGHIIIRLKGLSFSTAKAAIPSEDFALLKKVEEALAEVPAKSVTVEGHTDASGSKQTNIRLSEERAKVVKDFLISGNMVSEDKVRVEGKGFSNPIAPNRTKEGRAMNRRVDIVIDVASS